MKADETKKAAKKIFIIDASTLNAGDWCRVLGTVVSRYETEKYIIISLDDATATISVRVFDDKEILENVKIGDVVDVIGEIREYGGEKYILPKTAHVITNPNWELLRKLEIMVEKAQSKEKSFTSPETGVVEEEVIEEKKYLVLRFITELDSGRGVSYETLLKETKLSEKEIDEALNELISEGEIFEPKISVFKKV